MESHENLVVAIYECPINKQMFPKEQGYLDDVPPEAINCEFHPDQNEHYALLIKIEVKEKPKSQGHGVEKEI